jgi:hypothetical protein
MTPTRRRFSLVFACLGAAAAHAVAQAAPVPGDERSVRVYDLGPSVAPAESPRSATDAPPVVARLAIPAPEADGAPPPSPESPGLAGMARLVRAFVQPPLRADEQVQTLGERWLVLLGRAEQHAWLARFVANAKAHEQPIVDVCAEVFAAPEALFQRDIAVALQREAGKLRDVTVLAAGHSTSKFLAALQGRADVPKVVEQHLTARMLQQAELRTVDQTAYVRDFDVQVQNGAVIADPVIGTVEDGISLQAVAMPLENGTLGLSLDLSSAVLTRPIPTFTTNLGVGADITIQLPHVRQAGLEAAMALQRDQTAVVVLPALAGKRYFAIVTAATAAMPAVPGEHK